MALEGRRRYLPEELQEKIQICLPPKSFVRFESVCKTWQSRFAGLYNLLRGSFGRSDLPKEDLYSMVPGLGDHGVTQPWERHDTVLGCSTILCLISIHRSFDDIHNLYRHSISSTKFALLNPVTRNHIFTNPIPPELSSIVSLSEPSEILFGFGTHNSDYRVVVLIRYGSNFTSSLVLLYSLLSGEWKKTLSAIPQETRIDTNWSNRGYLFRDCFVSGCWHWLITLDDGTHRVMSFNFGNEEFRLIRMPEPPQIVLPRRLERQTWVYKERLVVLYLECFGPDKKRLNVWAMKEYGAQDSWRRVYEIWYR